MKNPRLIAITLAIALGALAIFQVVVSVNSRSTFMDVSYSGIIEKIEYRPGRKGFPDILINGNWIEMRSTESHDLRKTMQEGDSIVKQKGNYTVYLYRRDSIGNYSKKYEFTSEY